MEFQFMISHMDDPLERFIKAHSKIKYVHVNAQFEQNYKQILQLCGSSTRLELVTSFDKIPGYEAWHRNTLYDICKFPTGHRL